MPKKLSIPEEREVMDEISTLLMSPGGPTKARALLKEKRGFSLRRANKVIAAVYEAWHEEDQARLKYKKVAALRRIHGWMAQAAKRGQYAAIAQLEGLLARIEGLEQPLQVEHTHDHLVAIHNVIAGMEPSALEGLLAEHDEMERRAALYQPAPPPQLAQGDMMADE